jgi:hypothetical protein
MAKRPNRYAQIMELIFLRYYQPGSSEIGFERTDIARAAQELGIDVPSNVGDNIYSFRYRASLPPRITQTAPEGYEWIIRGAGRSQYKFVLIRKLMIQPSAILAETKIPDSTPGVVNQYTLNDEQALLAKIRYNRLIDIFTGRTCYSLQNHFRTTLEGGSQVETDEIYIGLDKRGAHYVIPVQAKGGKDRIGRVQIEQDYAVCAQKFPDLICLPIAAQFMANNLIALFVFEQNNDDIAVSAERHYRLVKPDELSVEELANYRARPL